MNKARWRNLQVTPPEEHRLGVYIKVLNLNFETCTDLTYALDNEKQPYFLQFNLPRYSRQSNLLWEIFERDELVTIEYDTKTFEGFVEWIKTGKHRSTFRILDKETI